MNWDFCKNKAVFKITPAIFYLPKNRLLEFGWLWWSFVIKLNGKDGFNHEMANGWLYGIPYEMAAACKKMILKLSAILQILRQKRLCIQMIFMMLVCVEYLDGERFWCHFSKSKIDSMLEEYADLIC